MSSIIVKISPFSTALYSNVQLYTLPADELALAAEAEPLLYKDVLFESGRRLLSNIQQVENSSLKTAPRRIAYQLVFLAQVFGELTPEGIRLLVPITHQNLSEMVNLYRETVTLAITKLRSLGLVHEDKHLVIP